jgi:hypothetical protein
MRRELLAGKVFLRYLAVLRFCCLTSTPTLMKTEVKVAIIGGAVTILVAIITGLFGVFGNHKSDTVALSPPVTQRSSPSAQQSDHDAITIKGNRNIGKIKAGRDVTIQINK